MNVKQLGSGWDAELVGVSSESKLFAYYGTIVVLGGLRVNVSAIIHSLRIWSTLYDWHFFMMKIYFFFLYFKNMFPIIHEIFTFRLTMNKSLLFSANSSSVIKCVCASDEFREGETFTIDSSLNLIDNNI